MLAKIGQLMLNRGVWNGTRLLNADYLDDAMSFLHPSTYGTSGYGFQTWIETDYGARHLAGARGWGGQDILVATDEHLVMVFTGSIDHPAETNRAVKTIVSEHVLPAHP